MERREAAVLGGVRIGAVLEQELDDLGVRTGGRAVQRSHVDGRVAGDEIHLGAALEQDLRRFLLAEERGEVQRREAVRRPGCDELGLAVEQLLQPARPPDRSGVEDVERRIRVQQRLDEVALAVVERVQDRREAVGVPRSGQVGIEVERVTERVLVAGVDQLEDVHPRSSGRVRHVGPPSPLREISSPRYVSTSTPAASIRRRVSLFPSSASA